MSIDATELYWLERNWGRTWRTLVPLLKSQASGIFEQASVGRIDDEAWSDFLKASGQAMAGRAGGNSASNGLYTVGITLLAEAFPLRREIQAAGRRLTGPGEDAVRYAVLRRGLINCRHALTGETEHKGKTWSRLDRISRDLHAAMGGDCVYGRCHEDHFKALQAHIRTERPNEKNLPRSLTLIEDYFHAYCPDCLPVSEGVFDGGPLPIDETHILVLPQVDRRLEYLETCRQDLQGDWRRVVEAKFGLGDVIEFSVQGFCAREGMERRRFQRLLDEALVMLQACIQRKSDEEVL